METEIGDDKLVYSSADSKGRVRTVRIVDGPRFDLYGTLKRPRPPSDSDEEIKKFVGVDVNSGDGCSEASSASSELTSTTHEALINAVTSVRTYISKLEAALQGEEEAQVTDIIRKLKREADSSIRESYKASMLEMRRGAFYHQYSDAD